MKFKSPDKINVNELGRSIKKRRLSKRISIVIPTFNHKQEPIQTITRILKETTGRDEIIVVDQNQDNICEVWDEFSKSISKDHRVRIINVNIPSTTLARNIGGLMAESEIILYLDDDMDISSDIIQRHLKYYHSPEIGGVAGTIKGVNGETNKRLYVKSAKGGNMSFRRHLFLALKGFDIKIDGNFSGEETEFCERVRGQGFKIANGTDCVALHRAPVEGGAGNQGTLTLDWYEKTYSNHFYWMRKRKGPGKLTMLPWHFYYLIRYFTPSKDQLLSFKFIITIYSAIKKSKIKKIEQPENEKVWHHLRNNAIH